MQLFACEVINYIQSLAYCVRHCVVRSIVACTVRRYEYVCASYGLLYVCS